MNACAYCGHPEVHHAPARCWTDVRAVGGGWRDCTCTSYTTASKERT